MKDYTQIQNEIHEKLSLAEFAGADYRVIHVILRKTNGWHKEEDWISLTQFEKLTGLSRKSVVKSLQRLINAKVLLVTKSKLLLYKLNPDIDSWVVTKSKLVTICTPTSYQMEQKVVTKSKHTKETITKETITKETFKGEDSFTRFIDFVNTIRKVYMPSSRGFGIADKKARRQYDYLLKSKYKKADFEIAIVNMYEDRHHRENNYKWITPEFITRADKFEMFLTRDSFKKSKYFEQNKSQVLEDDDLEKYLEKLRNR